MLNELTQIKKEKFDTHHSVSNCVAVGSELGVDVGEEPAERSTLESGSQGFPLRNVPDVYS